jgi:TnpA family transposase
LGWTRSIDAELIEQNWDNILRLIATIMLKETTASEIFRRLNSYSGLYAQTLENSVRQFAITFLGLIGSNP